LQFHGNETPDYCKRFKGYKVIKAIRVGDDFDLATLKNYDVDAFLFDTFRKDAYGGTGEPFDWTVIKNAKNFNVPIILSGGLNPTNVREAIDTVRPFAVDVSSGVEVKPGIKDERAMQEFLIQASI